MYFASKSYKAVQEKFWERYPGFQTLNKNSIEHLVGKFQKKKGTVKNFTHNKCPNILTAAKMVDIKDKIMTTFNLSIHKLASQV